MHDKVEDSKFHKMQHSAEHILAHALTELYPGKIKLAVAHLSEDGFSNDAEWSVPISEDDLPKIEKKMKEIIKKNLPITRVEVSYEEAKKMFEGNPYKLEWLEEIKDRDDKISLYKTGDEYVDLCKGPHVESTGQVPVVKLMSTGGAYWRGDENNIMLTRIYGIAFETKKELAEYLHRLEEAKKRDHRKLGKELDLFVFSETVGKGLPMWTKRGTTVRRELERFITDEEIRRGYQHVMTPDIARIQLYEKSGHYPYYKDGMYNPIDDNDEKFMLRPMTCPHHFELYLTKQHSYRELPVRIAELAQLYRYEQSGELSGLMRVRTFCLADAHIICTKDQAKSEIDSVLDLIDDVVTMLGLEQGKDYSYRLSLGDRSDDNKKYYKDDASWEYAEGVLREVLTERKAAFVEAEDEAAFYGPKIDVQMKNVLGKEDTAFTVQYDFVMPKRFELKYIDENGEQVEGIVVHRSSIGSIERTMALMIERYEGAFPAWLSPEQAIIIPIGEDQKDFAFEVQKQMKEIRPELRVEIDDANETLGKKVRNAQKMKIPYILVVGKQEVENGTVNMRLRTGENIGELSIEDTVKRIGEKIDSKALDL